MLDLSPNLMVNDVNATLDFYINVLQFTKIATVPETGQFFWGMVKSGSVSIMFQQTDSIQEEYPELINNQVGGSFTLYIHVTDVHSLFGQIKEKVKIIKEIHTLPYGAIEFAIKDLNGYILVFSQNPG